MTQIVIHKFDCDNEDCDKSLLIEQAESNLYLTQREEVEAFGWHLEISECDDNTQLVSHYCHRCWLEQTILNLGERVEELQAEYSKLFFEGE